MWENLMEERERQRRRQAIRRKRRRRQRRILLGSFALLLSLILGGVIYLYTHPLFLKSDVVKAELNEEFDPTKNVRFVFGGKKSQVEIQTDADLSKEGEYPITYKFRGQEKKAIVKVQDTTPPSLELQPYTTDMAEEIKPELFVKEVKDFSEVKVRFKEEPDFQEAKEYTVSIVAEDASGNQTVKETKLIRKKDETKPEIQGIEDVEILQGKILDLQKDVTVKDDMDPNPSLSVDQTAVDFNTPGTYEAVYKAKDRSGNVNEIKRKIVVKENKEFNQKIVYLTFDDGPSDNTEKIIDILDEYNAKATFFVTGNNRKKNDLITKAHKKGHAIGLHTYTHDYASVYSSLDAYFSDLQKISDMVESLTGEKSKLIRFPGGSSNTISAHYTKGIMTEITKKVQEQGYQYFDWNCDSTDASGNHVPVEKLVANATSGKGKHINILMHDTDAKDTTVKALPKIIEHYRAQGYVFKALTVDSYAPHHHVNN